jgi:hypothetical protein
MLVGYEDYKHNYDFSNVRGVIHVGAHHGQEYVEYISEYGGHIKTHWFEPGAEAFGVLKEIWWTPDSWGDGYWRRRDI